MSINFEKPVSAHVAEMLGKAVGSPVAADRTTFLHNQMREIDSRVMREIANAAKQPVVVELNEIGTVKVIQGVQWRLGVSGWARMFPEVDG